MKPKNAIKPH